MIFMISHSQGVIVNNFLLHRLIDDYQIIDPMNQHVRILSMAGIHLGPYPDIPGDFYSATSELYVSIENSTLLKFEVNSLI